MDELRQIGTSAGVRVPSFHDLLEALNHQVYYLVALKSSDLPGIFSLKSHHDSCHMLNMPSDEYFI